MSKLKCSQKNLIITTRIFVSYCIIILEVNLLGVLQGQTPVDDTDGKTKDDSEDFKKRLRKDLMTRDANR